MVVRVGSVYSGDYQLRDGQLCAIVDGEFVPCYKLKGGAS